MPSQLYDNEGVTFVCAKNFTYNGKAYEIGTDFPDEDLVNSPEVLIRSRFLIPVVESWEDKPRHWHREIQLKSVVLEKLGVTGESLLNKPTRVATVVATEDLPTKDEAPAEAPADEKLADEQPSAEAPQDPPAFDPSEHNVDEVVAYLMDQDITIEEYNRVMNAEEEGKARKTVLGLRDPANPIEPEKENGDA